MSGESKLAALTGEIVISLLNRSHLLEPGMVAGAITEAVQPLGIRAVRIYLSDLQQRSLRLLPGSTGEGPEALEIGSTVAGLAYRSIHIQRSEAPLRLWIPLIDGTERLGVLELEVTDVSEAALDAYRAIASMAGLMMVSKASYSDTYAQTRRTRAMSLQAELVWAFLPPRTFATDRVLIAATLEPAYAVGGDAFDYSLLGDNMHVAIFDATGHDLAAGLMASVAMASSRSTRRSGGSLADIATLADHAIATEFGGYRFVTALLCHLDVKTGLFTWLPCGHPPPLLIRRNRTVKELVRPQRLPLGLSEVDRIYHRSEHAGAAAVDGSSDAGQADADRNRPPVHTVRLEAGDRILLYTDGITEGRAADGTPFGVERLSDFVIRHSHDGTPAPEMIRGLHHAISAHQHGTLIDDATIVTLEWMPDRAQERLTP
jgi:Stage II sporulation protein E (SpoIIE)